MMDQEPNIWNKKKKVMDEPPGKIWYVLVSRMPCMNGEVSVILIPVRAMLIKYNMILLTY